MKQIQKSLENLRTFISSDPHLTVSAVDDMFTHAKDSLERLAFAKILQNEVSEADREIYSELLEMD